MYFRESIYLARLKNSSMRLTLLQISKWGSSDQSLDLTLFDMGSYTAQSLHAIGQVAQLVERGPEKAGVGGSIPSLATI